MSSKVAPDFWDTWYTDDAELSTTLTKSQICWLNIKNLDWDEGVDTPTPPLKGRPW